MQTDSRVGPYIRALAAALHALAPNEDFVPLRPALAHVFALDPKMSGDVLAPAGIDPRSGMPGFAWMERAHAEQVVARERSDRDDPSDEQLSRAAQLDPVLAERMGARAALHRHLRREELLPTTRLRAVVRRIHGTTRVGLTYDRMAPLGYWVRIRAELETEEGRRFLGAITINDSNKPEVEGGLVHLLTRHSFTPLMLLREQLQTGVDADVVRLTRSQIGPFWFPGSDLPEGVPESLGKGLVLHASVEMSAEDIAHSGHLDPWRAPPELELLPEGYGVFRQRRLAVSMPQIDAANAWYVAAGLKPSVVPIRPHAAGVGRR